MCGGSVRKRLTFILATVALASIVLVGAGVLVMSSIGARDEARSSIESQLQTISQLSTGSRRDTAQLTEAIRLSRSAFSLTSLSTVVVVDGEVMPLSRRRSANQELLTAVEGSLSDDQLDLFNANQPILIDDRRAIVGIQRLAVQPRDVERLGLDINQDISFAVVARRDIRRLPPGVLGWFLGSSALVLVGAVIAGRGVAGRFLRPIGQIEATTAALAQGRLDTRTPVSGSGELARLAQSVNTMAGQLQLAKDRDRQFLMSVSHDLRTPLTAIAGYAEALVDGPLGAGGVDGRQDAVQIGQVIGEHAERLERMVTDLLDLARLDSNRFTLNLTPVDLTVVAGRAVAGMHPLADQADRRLRLAASAPPDDDALPAAISVRADADRVIQIIENLVTNALRFAESDVEVAVTRRPDAPFGEIRVSNDGPPIATDDLPYVFDRLYVGETASDHGTSNTGLGLAIVKELTEAMGGSVSASSKHTVDALTVFTVRLPLVPEPT